MNPQEIDTVRVYARAVLSKLGIKEPPVNILEIAEHFKAKVVFSEKFPDDVFGCLLPLKNGEFVIVVNVFTSDTRKIFTVAHEIGHLYLRHHIVLDKFYSQKRLQSSALAQLDNAKGKMERLANVFASELLMPKHLVKRYYGLLHGDIDKLAEVFIVSKEAMEIRLKELGLLGG